jgi:Cdc6-like AAA superfamily ATPase
MTGTKLLKAGISEMCYSSKHLEVIPSRVAFYIVFCFSSLQFIELNGMCLTEPRQAYVQLLNALTGQTVTAEKAQQLLVRRFSRAAHRRVTTLLLVDEVISHISF